MVFISHDIQTVRYISDRIIVMNGGQAVEQGKASGFREPQRRLHPASFSVRLLRCFIPGSWQIALYRLASKLSDESRPAFQRAFLQATFSSVLDAGVGGHMVLLFMETEE